MLIGILGQKGGIGKTSLTALLAEHWSAKGFGLRLIDGDYKQRSLHDIARASKGRIPAPLLVAPEDYGQYKDEVLTLIDTPGSLEEEFFAVALDADAVIMPCPTNALDLRTLEKTLKALSRVQRSRDRALKTVLVPNRVALRERMSRQVIQDIQNLGFPVTKTYLRERSAYKRAGIAGLAALPASSRRLAVKEVSELAKEIELALGISLSRVESKQERTLNHG